MSHNMILSAQQLQEAKQEMDFLDSSFFKQNQRLPSPAEVRALSTSDTFKPPPVIFEHLNLLVKFGPRVTIAEGQTLWIIRRILSDEVPVPELYGWRVDGREVFIYMQLIRGQRLKERWYPLSDAEKTDVYKQLGKIMMSLRQLQQLPSNPFIGSIDHQHPPDIIFESMPIAGPFASVGTFNNWISWLPQRALPDSQKYEDPWRPLLPDTDAITFTHGDLHRGNILISKTNPPRILAIVDWGQAVWYPDYWEYCKAAYTCWYSGEWRNRWLPTILRPRLDVHEAFSEYVMAIGAI